MAASYLPYLPDQDFLLPPSMSEWLPEGHLAYFVSDTVDSLDWSAFHGRYDKGGSRNQPFHPSMMVKVLLYGYATGVFSSRKIAAKLHEDVAFRILAAGNFPADRTLRDFRAVHLKEISELFVQVVKLAREMGLVKLGTIAVDGTKVKANASRHKAMSYGHMREQRLAAIAQARARLEQRQREADLQRGRNENDERKPRDKNGKPKGGRYKRDFGVPEDKAQENFTDPDSRIMKRAGGGFDAAYNAQLAVDEAHIIVAAELTNVASDAAELPRMIDAVEANLGQAPAQALADTGYRAAAVFERYADSATELIVAARS